MHSTGFKDFLLKNELNRAINECGFEQPSAVQQECIPYAIMGKDVICQAVSGRGKTAVFILSVLHQLDDDPQPVSVLILCNTRELAHQIKKECDRFTTYLPKIRKECFFGGVPVKDHMKILDKNPPHIVIGTPGRILQLVKDKALVLDNLQVFILDECDKMLEEVDMRKQVQTIYTQMKHQKQVMMFSATLSDSTKKICKMYMKDPFEYYIDNDSKLNLHGLQQYFVKLDEREKNQKLMNLLDDLEFNQVIVFTSKRERAMFLNNIISKESFPSCACYSSMPMPERLKIYNKFKEGQYRIMVCTDLLGRGIDIEKINIVINYDMPTESDQYLHRVGRAGRYGTKGLAISFIASPEDIKILDEVQSRFEVKIEDLPASIDKSTYMNN